MRISDWSSDVCSSDLPAAVKIETGHAIHRARDDKAIGHPVASAGNDAVAEMFGQIENALRIGDERAIALDLVPIGPRTRSERLPVEARQGKTGKAARRSEEHTSELQSLMRISYA